MLIIVGSRVTRLAIGQPIMAEVRIPIVGGVTVRTLPWEMPTGWRMAGLTIR